MMLIHADGADGSRNMNICVHLRHLSEKLCTYAFDSQNSVVASASALSRAAPGNQPKSRPI